MVDRTQEDINQDQQIAKLAKRIEQLATQLGDVDRHVTMIENKLAPFNGLIEKLDEVISNIERIAAHFKVG
jgi:hypothetical protein